MDNESSRTGTRMYAPPEIAGRPPFTMQGDVYALGVLLYQMVVGDLERPLAPGWERDVQDDVLRELIEECVDGHLERRLSSAAVLAERVRGLESERTRRHDVHVAATRAKRRKTQLRWTAVGMAVFSVLTGIFGFATLRERRYARQLADEKNKVSLERQTANETIRFMEFVLGADDPDRSLGPAVTVRQVMQEAVTFINAGMLRKPKGAGEDLSHHREHVQRAWPIREG